MSGAVSLIAFLDASVLYPASIPNVLLRLALANLYAPRWSAQVQDEWVPALLRNRPDLTRTQLERTRALMETHLDDAAVEGYEHLIEQLTLPDADDRHVLAAAIHCGAPIIVTRNLKDFPAETLKAHSVTAQHPDDFVLDLIGQDKTLVLFALRQHRESLKNPPETAVQYLAKLQRHGLAKTAEALKSNIDDL